MSFNTTNVNTTGTVDSATQDGAGTPISSTNVSGKQGLDVNIINSSTSVSGVVDNTAFIYGNGVEQPIGGVYQDTSPTVTAGNTGAIRMTQYRGMHTNLRDASGNEVGTAGNPIRVDPTGTTTQPVSGTVSISGTVPVSATNLDIRDLVFASDKVDASGTTLGANSGVDIGDVTINNASGASAVNIQDGGNSITVDGSVSATVSGTVTSDQGAPNTTSNAWPVKISDGTDNADVVQLGVAIVNTDKGLVTQSVIHGLSSGGGGAYVDVKVTPSGSLTTAIGDISGIDGQATMANSVPVVIASDQSAVPVSATDLDIRNLVFATDKVDASGTTLGANSGVDIGDVTINNASGASAVNIQDGGNSITVDGTVAATQSGTWVLGSNSGVDIGDVTINNAAGASAVNIQDGGNSITVDGTVSISGTVPVSSTDLDIRDLVFATDKVDVSGSTVTVNQPVAITDNGGSLTVDNAGTFAVQATQAGTWVLGANSGVDIGDVTINNAAGASAVNIQDGGNSITVDGTVAVSSVGGTVSVSGTVTANAGTNLNTSALNLETTQTAFSARFTSNSSSVASVAGSASSVTLLASNSNRKGASIYNDSTANLYVKFGATASTSSFTCKVGPNEFFIMNNDPVYTGVVDGIWDSATGNARTTELS